MKKKLLFVSAIMAVIAIGCKKEDDTTPETTSTTSTTTTANDSTLTPADTTPMMVTVLIKDVTTSDDPDMAGIDEVSEYSYNSDHQLVKIEYSDGTTVEDFDTLIYNTSGQITSNSNYDIGSSTANTAFTFNYNSAGEIESMLEVGEDEDGMYEKMSNMTYTNGKLSYYTSTYIVAGGDEPDNDTITNIVFDGENVASVNYNGMGITVEMDKTALNPYYGLFTDPSEFTELVSVNNITSAYLTDSPSDAFVDVSYTYANDRVATMVSSEVRDQDSTSYTVIETTVLTFGEIE